MTIETDIFFHACLRSGFPTSAIISARRTLCRPEARFHIFILGGYQLSLLALGWDYEAYIRHLDEEHYRQFLKSGVVTYLLQSRHVAYTADHDLQSQLSFYAEFDPKHAQQILQKIDKITIAGYAAQAASLSNLGCAGEGVWSVTPVAFASVSAEGKSVPVTNGVTTAELCAWERDGKIQIRPDGLFSKLSAGTSDWKTVHAIIAKMPKFYRHTWEQRCYGDTKDQNTDCGGK